MSARNNNRSTGRRRTFPAFTEERAQEIIKYLGEGQNRETAALLAGISVTVLRQWFAWGEGRVTAGREPPAYEGGSFDRFAAFAVEAKKAEKRAISVAVDAIRKAGEKNWCAFAWVLERMHPEQFADNRKLLKELQFSLAQSQKLAAEQSAELQRLRGERADQGSTTASGAGSIADAIGASGEPDNPDTAAIVDSPEIRTV